ncbi:MOSC domain-containing protein [Nocardioides mangrovi]|uniref:MOSC domain-containing protein n=1 Tax=Nocardioides mangrovi TaxID=2874580 RepID=A0ABS7UI50_9ACTN|nr:MOSC domain-containing protein [Nocardioides mangrovi]MBZ5740704.1 MOSC domain-containing protein [Nocardioides mangrovi]
MTGTITVSELSVTAVKGFGLTHPDRVEVETSGAVGDRDFFLVDDADRLWSVTGHGDLLGHWTGFDRDSGVLTLGRGEDVVLSVRVERGEPIHAHLWGDRYQDGHVVTGPWQDLISGLAGDRVRLVWADTPSGGVDVEPVTLVSRSSVAAVGAERDGAPLDPRRFRMLLTLDGAEPWTEESWAGREIEVGGAVLRVGGEVPRCAAVQRDPRDGGSAVKALTMIADVRGRRSSHDGQTLNMGVYASVVRPGPIAVGDIVTARQ